MMNQEKKLNWVKGLYLVGIIWLTGALLDRLWFSLDYRVPAWDQAEHLNSVLNYWQILQDPHWFDGKWWRQFWLISPKKTPLTYILTVPFFQIFGMSLNVGTLVMLLFSPIMLLSVYIMGLILFDVSVGLWAAGLCQLFPGLYYYRLEYLLDYPLAAMVSLSFCLLTWWYFQKEQPLHNWLSAIAFGLSLGIAFMTKQTAIFFFFLPILWLLGGFLLKRKWGRLSQLIIGLCCSLLVLGPWFRTNWLMAFGSGQRATVESAMLEGDPPLNTLDAWTYYGKILPDFLSWVLLLVPIVGFLMSWIYWKRQPELETQTQGKQRKKWLWLAVFLIGGYLLFCLNVNKDGRYIIPLFPVLSLILALGLLSWRGRWGNQIRWGTAIIGLLLMLFNMFPIGGDAITAILSPHKQHYPDRGKTWPHKEVIEEALSLSPYLRINLGTLFSTPELNPENFSFYGGTYDFQVFGRQVGVREKDIEVDARSLDWFLTKTGYQSPIPQVQEKAAKRIEQGLDFNLERSWELPDKNILKLYHHKQPLVEVKPFPSAATQVRLEKITIPEQAPAGSPIPVTYEWTGQWEQLQSGLVLLTWEQNKGGSSQWLHDHGIGMGQLHPGRLTPAQYNNTFRVIERTAMLPEKDVPPGKYTLKATYLNRKTGETYPIALNPIRITIDPAAPAIPAPELDLVTQLRTASAGLALGIKGVEPIFPQTSRINQYDPIQDYLVQADQSLTYRIAQQPQPPINWVYALSLSKVLQQDVSGAIAALQKVIELAPNNPYHYGYLAFVYLYDWQPQAAQKVLETGLKLNPEIKELKLLKGIAGLMQGNLFQAWSVLHNNKQ